MSKSQFYQGKRIAPGRHIAPPKKHGVGSIVLLLSFALFATLSQDSAPEKVSVSENVPAAPVAPASYKTASNLTVSAAPPKLEMLETKLSLVRTAAKLEFEKIKAARAAQEAKAKAEALRKKAEILRKKKAEALRKKKAQQLAALKAKRAEIKTRQVKLVTWNVCSQFCPRLKSWPGVRAAESMRMIKNEKPDVILLQETGVESRDLKAIISGLGSDWKIAAYERSKVIFYNSKSITTLDAKGKKLPSGYKALRAYGDTRYAVYAGLRPVRATNIFSVGNLHVKSSANKWKTRDAQFRQALDELSKYPGVRIIGGDFNSYGPREADKKRSGVNRYAVSKGYRDTVATARRSTSRNGSSFVTTKDSQRGTIGKQLDHFYAPSGVDVLEWSLSERNKLSDHRYITTVIQLPRVKG